MRIDCETCTVGKAGPAACDDCVVTFLTIGRPSEAIRRVVASDGLELDPAEQHAIGVLAASGLVPPLRMEPAV